VGGADRSDDIVIVHDWVARVGGAETVLRELAALFPNARILTLFSERGAFEALGIDPARVQQSYLNRLPHALKYRRFLLPFFADAVQTLSVGDARLIISASHAVAKGIPHRSYQRHLAYVYSPIRYAHDLLPEYLRAAPAVLRPWLRSVLRKLAAWDVATAVGVTEFLAISSTVAERIWRTYRRRAGVVHPPVDVNAIPFGPSNEEDYYVVLSRLVAYKRIDIALAAAALVGRRVVVVGEGPERKQLERLVRQSGTAAQVEFTGRVTDERKYEILSKARGLLFPGEEDFGLVGVEALATGTPIVALGRGGMLDVVGSEQGPLLGGPPRLEPGGVVFGEQSASAMADAIRALEESDRAGREVRRGLAMRFDVERFRTQILAAARGLLESSE
jgi:glycosyltransferase involved in cell wall biosynthesis